MSEIKDSGGRTNFESGAVRDSSEGKAAMHWLPPFFWERYAGVGPLIKSFLQTGEVEYIERALDHMLEEHGLKRLCDHLEAGASKYEAYNWAKGMPVSRTLDSLGHHLEDLRKGEEDEDHAAAAMCNLMFIVHYVEIGLNDMPAYDALAPGEGTVAEEFAREFTESFEPEWNISEPQEFNGLAVKHPGGRTRTSLPNIEYVKL